MNVKQVFDTVREMMDALDGVGTSSRRALYAAVPLATLATSGCGGMYGMPWAEFRIDGTVVDAPSGDPVEGIQVEYLEGGAFVTTTEADGTWSLSFENDPFCAPTCDIHARDIDGDEHGAYQDLDTTVTLSHTEEGHGSWDEGRYEAHDVVLEIEPVD
jgi:putative lipoprotein (rSAM/lipoprotein system)